MTYLPIAILAFFLNSLSVTVDKFLLTKTVKDPVLYVFYFSIISLLLVPAIFFIKSPSLYIIMLASISTICWTIAAYAMFKALMVGQVQRVIPVIGTLTPIFLLIMAKNIESISATQTWAIIFLILGLILLNLGYFLGQIKKQEIILEIVSGLFFALAYFLLRIAFLGQDFLTVLIYSRPVLIPLGIILILIPAFRRKISNFQKSNIKLKNPSVWLFAAGQVSAGFSELMLTFAISLTSPAIVNSLQGIKYIFLMIFGFLLGKRYPEVFLENSNIIIVVGKGLGIGTIVAGLYLLAYP